MWVDHLQARPSGSGSAAVWVLSKQGTPTYQLVKNEIKKAGLRGCSGQHVHIFSITPENEKDIDKLGDKIQCNGNEIMRRNCRKELSEWAADD